MKTVILCLLLTGCVTGCAGMPNLPVCPEVTVKLCPSVIK